MAVERLNPELEDKACEMVIEGKSFAQVATFLGKTRSGFEWYRRTYPDFERRLKQAELDNCRYLEEQLLEIPLKYDADTSKQLSQNIMKILGYRKPDRYSERIDMNINQTVDITGALTSAEQRVIDVTPIVKALKESNDSE